MEVTFLSLSALFFVSLSKLRAHSTAEMAMDKKKRHLKPVVREKDVTHRGQSKRFGTVTIQMSS